MELCGCVLRPGAENLSPPPLIRGPARDRAPEMKGRENDLPWVSQDWTLCAMACIKKEIRNTNIETRNKFEIQMTEILNGEFRAFESRLFPVFVIRLL